MSYSITSVKINDDLYRSFKEKTINTRITFQNFVNCCLEKYHNDVEFKNEITKILEKPPLPNKTVINLKQVKSDFLNKPFNNI